MSDSRAGLYALIDSIFDGAKGLYIDPELRGFLDRWHGSEQRCKIVDSLFNQDRKIFPLWIEHLAPEDAKQTWRNLGEDSKRSVLFRVTAESVFKVFMQLDKWVLELKNPPLIASERREAIARISQNATAILGDFHRLGLPIDANHYFTEEEVELQNRRLIELLDDPEHPINTYWLDGRSIKDFLIFNANLPGTNDSVSTASVPVDLILKRMTDKQWIDRLAQKPIMGKSNPENWKRVLLIRKLTAHFSAEYGTPLQNTVANFCILILDDASIGRDSIRSALAGFKAESVEKWRSDFASSQSREAYFRGGKETEK